MSHNYPPYQVNSAKYSPPRSNCLRQSSTASTSSSAHSVSSNLFFPSRTSTISSSTSSSYHNFAVGHKRGISEASAMSVRDIGKSGEAAAGGYKSARQSLKPLPQPPNPTSNARPKHSHSALRKGYSIDEDEMVYSHQVVNPSPSVTNPPQRPHSMVLDQTDSVSPTSSFPKRPHLHHAHTNPHGSVISPPDLKTLQNSSTSHLRNLSRFAQNTDSEDFSITSPAPSVIGLLGRRQLKRTESTRGSKHTAIVSSGRGSAWSERNWMDKQRQFLQAYEYLCHIGEAKEWIEDIIHKTIPPIVQLEEALRDGVTLAEVVQALRPDQPMRIFRHQKLQFRHSDNIAIFFRFLADVELPDLFRFELIDLYEKKNIPKVIYCIHALSWLLFRKGIVNFRIGNLVGQLEFEHHELEEMQKGLDKAGVSMPIFSGMGATFGAEPEPEPEPLPIESDEKRINRELGEKEGIVLELQAQIRGAVVRLRLLHQMQSLWAFEDSLVDMQARIRGDFTRQIAGYRLHMRHFAVNLQSAARGFLSRKRQCEKENSWKNQESEIIALQSFARARKSRQKMEYLRLRARGEESCVRKFQAAIRGALKRHRYEEQYTQAKGSETVVQGLQSAIRGALQRRRLDEQYAQVRSLESTVQGLQSAVRGAMQRKNICQQYMHFRETEEHIKTLQALIRGSLRRQTIANDARALQKVQGQVRLLQAAARGLTSRTAYNQQHHALQNSIGLWHALQAVSRGTLLRKRHRFIRSQLIAEQQTVLVLQSVARGKASRQGIYTIKLLLSQAEGEILAFQSASRAYFIRKKNITDMHSLRRHDLQNTDLQSRGRGFLLRWRQHTLLDELFSNSSEVINLQALSRAMLLRLEVGSVLAQLDDEELLIAALQAAARGQLVRAKFEEKKRFFKSNMEKVVKVQSFIRGKLQGEAYKSLTSGKNPPVGTVKGFVHLLNDSDFDFDEEVEFERLRKTVVQHVRQNEMADQYITQLDIKIALLVKNKITLDEVVKHQKHFGGSVSGLLTNTEISSKDPFDLKALNKASRRKLEHYQELFFVLQTQSQYLARLFKRLREQATAEKECERIKHLMMGLFGYAQKRREEYYLIKLITRSVKEEVDSSLSLQEYLRGNFFWAKLFGAYVKSPRDRKYMRDVLGPVVKENVIDNPELDLESDPLQIYLSVIENEQLRTGQRSQRRPDIPREEAIRDEETKRNFIAHLQDLRDIADQFLAAVEEHLHKMPYGVRYVAQQMFMSLKAHFTDDEPAHILQIVGHWVWRNYLQPALIEPEKFGVVDRGLSQDHKRNLGEVAKVLGQICAGRLFGKENVFLQPLNSYVGESIARLGGIWNNLINIPDAETQFDIDEFNDLYARTKPTLYIKMADIFSIHHLVAAESSYMCPNQDDMLREVIRELGSAKNNETELMHASNASTSEICLTLNPKLHDLEDPDAEVKALFTETKRCILYIIRIQSGFNLLEIMVKPITPEDSDKWDALVRDELSTSSRNNTRRTGYYESQTLLDISTMPYAELKRTALENILRLESLNCLTRHNHYQDLLNAIAVDIRTKHRRRIQRQRELEGVKLTLARLNDQAVYLEGQLKTYNDYIEQAMVTLQNKKGKKRFLMPFTKQWDHERELVRSGRVPKFGSFKYSAAELHNRGILRSWQGYPERHWDKIDLTISSNEVGVFSIEGSSGSVAMPGASAQVPLDDLLQAQYNGTQFLEFFGGAECKVNVNLFLHLIMRKFYKDAS